MRGRRHWPRWPDTTGHSIRYFTDAVAKGRESYYTGAVAAGEPPGRWYGAGAAALGLEGEVDADLMEGLMFGAGDGFWISRRRAFRCPSSCSTCVLIRKGALCNSVPQRRLLNWAQTILRSTLHLVREPADQRGFAVIRGRWAVERTSAWLTAHRRLARDRERDPATSEAMIRWAAINIITRRIARGGPRHPTAEAHFHHGKLIFTYTL
jgi:transposase